MLLMAFDFWRDQTSIIFFFETKHIPRQSTNIETRFSTVWNKAFIHFRFHRIAPVKCCKRNFNIFTFKNMYYKTYCLAVIALF